MATSSKVAFNLATLREKALESIDFRIAQAKLEVDSFTDDEALAQRIAEWEDIQRQRLIEFVDMVERDEVSTYQLAKFKLDPIPEVDRWDRARAIDKLRALEAKRSKIVAKTSALVPDENGSVSLTKTQLDEFFGL